MNVLNPTIQPNLFDLKPKLPEGFIYEPHFLSKQEEIELLKYMQITDFGHLEIHGQASKRGVRGYGVSYSFETGELSQGVKIPKFLYPLRDKVALWVRKKPEEFEEILITEYKPGSAISWHSDASPYEMIVGVSLLNPCKFKLRKGEAGNWENIDLFAMPRSAYIIQGESRWSWQHSIPPTKELRYSITLRTVRRNRIRV